MSSADAVLPFVFDSLPVRGAFVQLQSAWQRMQQDHDYPGPVAEVLGHAAAATALIAHSLKFDGAVTLQLTSDGPLSMLVMQSTDALDLRGMAASEDLHSADSFRTLISKARCAVTVDAGAMEQPYQGIVEVQPESLAASLVHYFERSVQVPSHLGLIATQEHCGGILLQQMPGEEIPEDDWRRLGYLAATLTASDLVNGVGTELIGKFFAEDDVRVFEPRPVRFHCKCSRERIADVLRMLGEDESRAALEDKDYLEVTCEFCGRTRRFDSVDVGRVFAEHVVESSDTVH